MGGGREQRADNQGKGEEGEVAGICAPSREVPAAKGSSDQMDCTGQPLGGS